MFVEGSGGKGGKRRETEGREAGREAEEREAGKSRAGERLGERRELTICKEDLQEVVKGVRKLELRLRPLQSHLRGPQCDPQFAQIFKNFVEARAEPAIKKISELCSTMQEDFKNLLVWFGEPPTVKANDFFAMFYDLASEMEVKIFFEFLEFCLNFLPNFMICVGDGGKNIITLIFFYSFEFCRKGKFSFFQCYIYYSASESA
jgi:hypothetical protein